MNENLVIVLLLVVLIGVPTFIAVVFENGAEAIRGTFDRSRARRAAAERRLESTLPLAILQIELPSDLATYGWAVVWQGASLAARSPGNQLVQLEFVARARQSLVKVIATPDLIDQLTGEVLAVMRTRDPHARVRAVR